VSQKKKESEYAVPGLPWLGSKIVKPKPPLSAVYEAAYGKKRGCLGCLTAHLLPVLLAAALALGRLLPGLLP